MPLLGPLRALAQRPGGGAGAASADAAGTTYTATGLKAGSSAVLYGNGTQIATATVDSAGNATWVLAAKPAAGTIITYDGVVVGSGGTVPSAGPTPLSISGPNGTATVGDTTSFTPTISGGTAPYSVAATGLPPGRSITNTATGLTTGGYTTASDSTGFKATYTVTDAAGATASFTRTVVVSAAAATLNALTTSGLLTNGLASSGIINGATTGSTLTSGLTGLTVNSALRTYAWDGTGSAGGAASALTETLASGSAKTSALTVLPASTGNLKISGRQFFAGEPAMFMILAGYASTSSLTVTSDDGTTITVGVNSQGYPLASGTFSTSGVKNLTISELPSGGGAALVSTVAVMVSPAPAAPSAALAKAKAARITAGRSGRVPLAVGSAPPTITLNTGASLVNGRSLAAGGSTPTLSVPDGFSGTGGQTSASSANGPYIYADTTQGPANMTYGTGTSKRFVFTGTTGSRFDFKASGTGAFGSIQVYILYCEDADTANPTWLLATAKATDFKSAVVYVDVNFPAPPARAGSRAVEVFFGQTVAVTGFNFEAGATIAPYDDKRLRGAAWNDSFDFPQSALDPTIGTPVHLAMDYLGSRNGISFGHRTNAWARLGGTTGVHAYVMDRFGSNPWALDEATRFGVLDLVFGHMSINDNTLSNYNAALTSGLKFSNPGNAFVQGTTTLQNMLQIAFRRMRLMQPEAAIVIDVGFHGPDATPTASVLAAARSAFAAVFDADPLAILADFNAGTYRWMGQTFPISSITTAPLVPSGAIGSSPLFPVDTVTFTGTISGTTLTVNSVQSGGAIQIGMSTSGAGGGGNRLYAAGTGTGGAGTYEFEFAPGDVTAATSMTLLGDYPHPNAAGTARWAQERGAAAVFMADKVASL